MMPGPDTSTHTTGENAPYMEPHMEPQLDFGEMYGGIDQLDNELNLDDLGWGDWNEHIEPQGLSGGYEEQQGTTDGDGVSSTQPDQSQPTDAHPSLPETVEEPLAMEILRSRAAARKRKAVELLFDVELPGPARKEKRVRSTEPDEPSSALGIVEDSPAFVQQRHPQAQEKISKGTGPEGRVRDLIGARPKSTPFDILDSAQYYTIMTGDQTFYLTGKAVSSDGPSYITDLFKTQSLGLSNARHAIRVDCDAATFNLIARHLQRLPVVPQDEVQYAQLFVYAQYYRLRRLVKDLYNGDVFVRVGDSQFRIPRRLFTAPGDTGNYFLCGHRDFFTKPQLDRFEFSTLRPHITPAVVPSRDGKLFGELLKLLKNQEIEIRNEVHRKQLREEAYWFNFRNLEQRLVPCDISYNPETAQTEILIPLEHIMKHGLSYNPDHPSNDSTPSSAEARNSSTPGPIQNSGIPSAPVTISYARPWIDDHAKAQTVVIEIPDPEMTLQFPPTSSAASVEAGAPVLHARATFHRQTLKRMVSLFRVISSKLGLSSTQPLGLMMVNGGGVKDQRLSPATSGISDDLVRVRISLDCYMELDGWPVELGVNPTTERADILTPSGWIWGGNRGDEQEYKWFVSKGQWKVRAEPVGDGGVAKWEVVLYGVRLWAFASQKDRNKARGFLSAWRQGLVMSLA